MADAKKQWPEYPLVSGLMAIDRPALLEVAREAQRCFFAQDWPCLELVVFNATGQRLNLLPSRRVREIRLNPRSRAGMLAIMTENAAGEWCVTWDPDCWYAPGTVSRHMHEREVTSAALFRQVTCYSLTDRKAFIVSDARVVHGSFFRMARLDFGKEVPFYKQTPRLRMIENTADQVVKFVNKFNYA